MSSSLTVHIVLLPAPIGVVVAAAAVVIVVLVLRVRVPDGVVGGDRDEFRVALHELVVHAHPLRPAAVRFDGNL